MKNNNILPQNLHDILIGLMLGDGHIYKKTKKLLRQVIAESK